MVLVGERGLEPVGEECQEAFRVSPLELCSERRIKVPRHFYPDKERQVLSPHKLSSSIRPKTSKRLRA